MMPRKYFYDTLIFMVVMLFVACGGGVNRQVEGRYDTLYAPRYAAHFVVLKSDSGVVLRVIDPWQGANGVQRDYLVKDKWSRTICMSSSHASFFDELGFGGRVVGVSASEYYFNKKFAALPEVGYDNNINVELIASLKPDIITAYELAGENSTTIGKLSSLGMDVVYVADYVEDTPLARAEWIVAFGALVGDIEMAKQRFDSVETRYVSLRDSVKKNAPDRLCKVMLNSPYRGVWYLPSDGSYMVRLIADAAGEYVAKGISGNVSRAVSTEVAYAKLLQADVWLNPSAHITSIARLKAESPLLKDIKMPIYNTTLRSSESGGSDFWESGVVRPDRVLADLIAILHPEILSGHELFYYEKLR